MDSTSTEFEVPRAVQKAAALGGLVIDAYLAAHESRQARIGAPQSGPKRPPFAEVLKQAGSSIPGLQDALVALAGEENAADLKKLAELVGDNPDLAELVRKATMNARGVVAPASTAAPSSARPAGSGEDLMRAALGAALARGGEADSRAQLLAMLRSSVEERLTLMDARLNGRVSALQQRVIHLEASIDGLAQDIERLKQRARERREGASRTAPDREPSPTMPPGPPEDDARPQVDAARRPEAAATMGPLEPTPLSTETSTASPRVEATPPGQAATIRVETGASASPAMPDTSAAREQTGSSRHDAGGDRTLAGTPDTVGPTSPTHVAENSTAPPPASRRLAPANEPAAESDARADQLLMTLLDAHESVHDARIIEGENVVANLERHVVTLTAQVRELTELHNDA